MLDFGRRDDHLCGITTGISFDISLYVCATKSILLYPCYHMLPHVHFQNKLFVSFRKLCHGVDLSDYIDDKCHFVFTFGDIKASN